MLRFIAGVLIGALLLFPLAAYLYVKMGFLSLATTASPLPFEESLAHAALRENVGKSRDLKSPVEPTEENLLAGATLYREHCAVCHGLPGQQGTKIAAGMFPDPPKLFEGHGVTDDPEGVTWWKISNGIRLSGMPRFNSLSETERWQMTLLLKQADKLPARVQDALHRPLDGPK